MNIRTATPGDAEVIAGFNRIMAQETERLALDPERLAAGVRAVLADPTKGIYYVAESGGFVVGQVMITYEWSDWRNGNIWWLQSVYVRPEFRGQGIFRALFKHVVVLAKQDRGVPALRLYMHSENGRARQCYENLGMSQTHYQVFEMDLLQAQANADRKKMGVGR